MKPALSTFALAFLFLLPLKIAARPQETSQETADSPIETQYWTKPQPGWLYVLDISSKESDKPRVLLIDPETSNVMGRIAVGHYPDLALSPDGTRLFVAAAKSGGELSELAMIDINSGSVLIRHDIANRPVSKVYDETYGGMAISADGKAVRIQVFSSLPPDGVGYQLTTFDAVTGKPLSGHVHLGDCGVGQFVSFPSEEQIDFMCPTSNRIRLISVDADSHEKSNSFVRLPWSGRIGVSDAFPVADGKKIAIIRRDGVIYEMDAVPADSDVPRQVFPAVSPDPNSSAPIDANSDDLVFRGRWPLSPDGSRVYLGFDGAPYKVGVPLVENELRVFDTHTWQRLGTIKTSESFEKVVIGNDGKTLYALSLGKLLVIDTATMRETRSIYVGGIPTVALVAPDHVENVLN